MHITCLDLEGVLIPEVWVNFAERVGIEELKLTTRDIPNYDELMQKRLAILKENKLTYPQIKEVINELEPLPGAKEFLDWLRSETQVVILSDTFSQFAWPFMEKLGLPTIFCHELEINQQTGEIINYKLRTTDHKRKAVQAFKNLNFQVVAAGDSYNDVSMLKEAHQGIFFCPPEKIVGEFPQFPVTRDYKQFQAELEKALR